MTTNYKNILLKDSQGNPLLPITLSYYVEYKNGVDVRSYLDTLSHDMNNVNGYIDEINAAIADQGQVQQNIIGAVNEILASYVQSPDHTARVQFDSDAAGLSSMLNTLEADSNVGYVTAQQAFEALDSYLDYAYNKVDNLDGRVTTLETSVGGLSTRLATAEENISTNTTNIGTNTSDITAIKNAIFNANDNVEIDAENVTFDGSTTEEISTATNVKEALEGLDLKLHSIDTTIEEISSYAGVSSVSGSGAVIVTGVGSSSNKTGAVSVGLNMSYMVADDSKIVVNNQGKLTVDESQFDLTNTQIPAANITGKIQTSQIEGGLDANNINITYSYTDSEQVVHDDGEKSVQEFYTETQTTLETIQSNIDTLNTSYQVTLTDDQGANSAYARVYTINQGGHEIGTINIPKDQFLKKVEYAYALDGVTPALVFTWNSSNPDATNDDTTYVPISSFIDAITGQIASDVTALDTRVGALESAAYVTAVSLDGVTGQKAADGTVTLISKLQFEEGRSTDGISAEFLTMHGI